MAIRILWTFTLILHVFHTAEGIRCLYGVDVPVPTDSDQVITCGSHQNCYMDAFATLGGHVRYNLGCRDKLYCEKTTDYDIRNGIVGKRSNEILVCTECCTGLLCNSVGCGHAGYAKQRGPICMSCDDQLTADDCNKITECGRDEVCMLSMTVASTTHGRRYQTKCEIAQVCHNEVQTYLSVVNSFAQGVIGRKRSLLTEKDVACSISCCHDDLCNENCTALSSIATTIPPTTTAPPTTTIPLTTTTATQSATKQCLSNPCVKGTCSEYYDTYMCTCETGYQGRHCEISLDTTTTTSSTLPTSGQTVFVNPCLFNPCANGICSANGTSYTCKCSPGFAGEHCSQATTQDTVNVDYCKDEPCIRGSCTSVQGYAGFVCMCAEGYKGQLCDTRINDLCVPNPCTHGHCSSNRTMFWCECINGFTGYTCDTVGVATSTVPNIFTQGPATDLTQKPNGCSTNPCVHGNCFPVIPSNFLCICKPGFTGNRCDQIDGVAGNGTNSKDLLTSEASTSTVTTSSTTHHTAHSCNGDVNDNLQYYVLKMSQNRSFKINMKTFGPLQQQAALNRCTSHCAMLLHVDSLAKLHAVEHFLRQHEGNVHQSYWVDGQWHNNNWISSFFHRTRSVQKRLFNWMTVLNHQIGHCVALTFDGNSAKLEPHICHSNLRPICEHI